MTSLDTLPIAVIGGGPVGLAAAAHLVRRGLPVRVYEAGSDIGAHVRDWGHVRLFSPWSANIDTAAQALLEAQGWTPPEADICPTGAELHEAYLAPLAATPALAAAIETGARVTGIARLGIDKVVSRARETAPFVVSIVRADGTRRRDLARAVIDASGTWAHPNPLGASGMPVEGEAACGNRIAYRVPDVLGRDRAPYAGQRVLVVGSGHSAANVLLDLARLAEDHPATSTVWAVRRTDLARIYGGGRADRLPARGELGARLRDLVAGGRIALVTGFAVTALSRSGDRVIVEGETADGPRRIGPVDRIVAATGQRPDLTLTRELRLDLDPWLESSRALGPMIDPNLHSCGSVPPHGHRELSHPEPGFYTVGVKSYGRAPTFLMLTGYEQVRSVAAALAGDRAAADHVNLVLPETGICSTGLPAGRAAGVGSVVAGKVEECCGGPAPEAAESCCAADAEAKARTRQGCGCAGSGRREPAAAW